MRVSAGEAVRPVWTGEGEAGDGVGVGGQTQTEAPEKGYGGRWALSRHAPLSCETQERRTGKSSPAPTRWEGSPAGQWGAGIMPSG